jgi:multidrug resistance efflux pump
MRVTEETPASKSSLTMHASEATFTVLAANIAGIVKDVKVYDFQEVHKGDPLLDLEDQYFRAQVDQARALVEVAKLHSKTIVRVASCNKLDSNALSQASAKRRPEWQRPLLQVMCRPQLQMRRL